MLYTYVDPLGESLKLFVTHFNVIFTNTRDVLQYSGPLSNPPSSPTPVLLNTQSFKTYLVSLGFKGLSRSLYPLPSLSLSLLSLSLSLSLCVSLSLALCLSLSFFLSMSLSLFLVSFSRSLSLFLSLSRFSVSLSLSLPLSPFLLQNPSTREPQQHVDKVASQGVLLTSWEPEMLSRRR